MRWLIRITRALLVTAACFLIAAADRRSPSDPGDITLDDARQLFPTAARFGPRGDHGRAVLNSSGEPFGSALQTSPHSDHLIGYSGPSNLLIGLDPAGRILAVRPLWSRDTPEHVNEVRKSRQFWDQFQNWNPALGDNRHIDGVSGSTLTSLAMAESIQARLAGQSTSLRFPDPATLEEVQRVFPTAASLKPDADRSDWLHVLDSAGNPLGFVLRTSPFAENVRGYSGPTEALVALDNTRRTVLSVRLRSSYDTPEYVERVRNDDDYLKSLAGRTIDDWASLDFSTSGIEGVSGATQTSYGLAEGIRRRLNEEVSPRPGAAPTSAWKPRDLGLLAVVAGGLLLTLVPRLGGRRLRLLWQIILVAVFGFWLGDMLSISLVAGWSRSGLPTATAPGLVALAAVALIVPWTTRRQVYCHAICPHGAVQEWLGRAQRFHIRIPRPLNRILGWLPALLLTASLVLAITRPRFNLAQLEPFDAWVLGAAAVVSFIVAIVGLVASVFIPQAYCRFGCPTGALLKLVRSHGQADHWRPHDLLAGASVLIAALWVYWPEPALGRRASNPNPALTILTGQAFGTTWTIKIRDPLAAANPLQEDVSDLLDQIESRLSHWRPGSETSQFNASETTLEMDCSQELALLVKRARDLSAATDGAFDITVEPLVSAWGYGPPGPRPTPPTDDEITRLLQSTGWSKLQLDETVPTLRKLDPAVRIDLGALLQGYAVDQVFEFLSRHGVHEFLIEIGGELRSAGAWQVALDPAAGSWKVDVVTLKDSALSMSGIYRRGPAGPTKHIISPKTGRPVETAWQATAVLGPTCLETDGWDTALLISPSAEEIAKAHSLKAQLISTENQPAIIDTWP